SSGGGSDSFRSYEMSNISNDPATPAPVQTPLGPGSPLAAPRSVPSNSRHLLWPILLTSLISIHIVSVVVMVIVATHDSSFAVEPDWYLKGLHYDQTTQQQRENSRLSCSVTL